MRLEQSFEVPVPVSQAWGVLLDVERVAPCMPGATLTGFDGTAFTGTVKVKLGPVNLAYKGNGRFVERDETGRRVAFVASGQDSRGAGGAQARVTAVLHETNGGKTTQVKVVADLDIAGRAAQFGRGMIADVSGKLIKQFADCLAETIATSPAAAPVAAAAVAQPEAAVAAPPAAAEPIAPEPVAPVHVVAEPVAPEAVPYQPVAAEPAPEPAAEPEPAEPAPAAGVSEVPAPEYHPLALQEPPPTGGVAEPEPVPEAQPAPAAEPEPVVQPETAYAYEPEPVVHEASPPTPPPAPAPSTLSRPQKEAEPIDLLAVSGARGFVRRAAPVLVIVGLIVIALIVWLIVA